MDGVVAKSSLVRSMDEERAKLLVERVNFLDGEGDHALTTEILFGLQYWGFLEWAHFVQKRAQKLGRRASFLQVGANDGQKNDPLYPILAKNPHAWLGLQVEPTPYNFKLLKKLHADKADWEFVEGAVSKNCSGSNISFFIVPRANDSEVPTGFFHQGQINSLSPNKAMAKISVSCFDSLHQLIVERGSAAYKNLTLNSAPLAPCNRWKCSCQFLSDVYKADGIKHRWGNLKNSCQKQWWALARCKTTPRAPSSLEYNATALYWGHSPVQVDVLVIDVEGYDWEVVHAIDFDILRPRVILYENYGDHNFIQASQRLTTAGYYVQHGHGDGANSLAIDVRSMRDGSWIGGARAKVCELTDLSTVRVNFTVKDLLVPPEFDKP